MLQAEVQSFYADGAIALHTRSLKYGKVDTGFVVQSIRCMTELVALHLWRFDANFRHTPVASCDACLVRL